MVKIPAERVPSHPGEVLLEDFLKPMGLALAVVFLGAWLAAAPALLAGPAADDAPPHVTPRKKALVIGIDGLRFDALRAARTPHLDALIEDGIYDDRAQVVSDHYTRSDTVSGPGWSSILTGVWADKHGVDDNRFEAPNYDRYPHWFSLLKQVRPQAMTASLVSWAPIDEHIVSGADVRLGLAEDEDPSYRELDAEIARRAIDLLATRDPTAMVVYFGQVDVAGHDRGFHPSVPQYVEAVERVDRLVGEMLHALRTRRTVAEEDWLILVTTDHGGRGTRHGGGRDIPEVRDGLLIVSGRSAARGRFEQPTEIVDVVPTALTHLGVPLDAAWELDGRPVGLAAASRVSFRLHTLSAESEYSACAAIDVNGNGLLDVVAGGWWYEAPRWTPHFVRDVERIRGRFDDYSHLPLDVNGNGRLDLVSANYRSRLLYWVENPGGPRPWTRHVIAEPGAMETARLVDIDGDGQLDVLPNGVEFAAWWELVRDDSGQARWARHDLPPEVAGHGVGAGDVDGDGRVDVVGPRGWARAPADPRRQRWTWHPEFRLHRDAGIPILVVDVTGDGANDLIWSRGHSPGIYWMQQQQAPDGRRQWLQHTIDSSWSQAHSLLWADVDGDGQMDLIAGKRYMGHDGRDVGEHDPLVGYWYKFDRRRRSWQRHPIVIETRAGFGLDPKAVDLDGDGDLDLVVSGRSGLFWLENLAHSETVLDPPPRPIVPGADDPRRLLTFTDDDGTLVDVTSPAQWAGRRADILHRLQTVMGPLPGPERRVPLDVQWHGQEPTDKYTRHRISFAAEPGDRVPAYLLVPHDLQQPTAALLCLHQTTPLGKDELAGLGGRPNRWFAHELAEQGFVCLVPDYPSFGEYEYDFERHAGRYASGTMKAIWNNLRAIDLLESLPEVDPDRIGAVGHSLGGHNALFTAAFDLRLRAVVTSCGFTAMHDYRGGDLAGWSSDRYMPRIASVHDNDPDRLPWDFHEVLAAMAPRSIFLSAPLDDDNFDVHGVRRVVDEVQPLYRLLDAPPAALEAHYPDAGHDFPDPVRQRAWQWLDERLRR